MDSRGYDDHRRNRGRSQRHDPRGEYVLRADGTPLTDRYGRPVRRRSATPDASSTPPRQSRPRQQMPPRREAPPVPPTRQYVPPAAAPQSGYGDYDSAPRQQYSARPPRRPSGLEQAAEAPRAPRAARPTRTAKQKRGGKRPNIGCLGCIGWPLAIVLVLSIVLTLWADTKLTRVEALPEQQVSKTSGTNWLLVGSDSRQGLSEEDVERLGTGGDIGVGRTDTVMLLHIPTGGKATLVSLPRDSYVAVPGYGMDKLNAAFTYGGPQLLTETVEQATGLRINHYAEIGMGGLANVVDSVGGVEVCPEEPIDDPLAQLSIQAGCQKVDGPTALGYVRTRSTAGGDLDRIQRQREFFSALLNQTTSAGTLLNPFRMIPLISDTASSFTVGSSDHVWNLARVALAMRSGVETKTVPHAGFADYDVGNVVLWDDAAAEELWASMR
ncbi:LCP family protein [Corynebacterium lowii]|uniref:Putative transcriptional regulator YwtF n=1 Tax=Corynebacterium lowii TaxID=1544413 RepID=A0A0N8VZB6_9CORY|nr:LCP family protein [Corynebacterium lowii]KQB83442.1 putative transcriptional regulator YwtF [Corynebacterium lowii]MDP9852487.1 LCP family protein required for cell wall assembly [Corynebacterium lowii]